MATTNIRWGLAHHLLDLLRDSPTMAGVLISAGWPGERAQPETIWLDGLDGQLAIPVMTPGRKERDDHFDIPIEIRVINTASLDEAMTRLTTLIATVEDVLAEDPSIDGYDGTIDAEITSERQTCIATREGNVGFAEIIVSAHARLE
jgi:hypothetical protein